jgi:hypothetical protein
MDEKYFFLIHMRQFIAIGLLLQCSTAVAASPDNQSCLDCHADAASMGRER